MIMTKEEMFNENIRLAYKIAHKYSINYPDEYKDILQYAFIGLWKAVCIYNETYRLSTIAYRIMLNEINMYLRRRQRNKILNEAISLDVVAFSNEDGVEDITYGDFIRDDHDMIEDIIYNIDVENCLSKMFLNETEKEVIRMRMDKKTQKEIGKKLGLSQCQISRIQKKVKNRLLNLIDRRKRRNNMDTKTSKLNILKLGGN